MRREKKDEGVSSRGCWVLRGAEALRSVPKNAKSCWVNDSMYYRRLKWDFRVPRSYLRRDLYLSIEVKGAA